MRVETEEEWQAVKKYLDPNPRLRGVAKVCEGACLQVKDGKVACCFILEWFGGEDGQCH